MKFWTTDPAYPDKLVIDMTQCDECDKWIPNENLELHLLYHKNRREQQCQDDKDDQSLPAFVMETIPCEDCMVLVPKQNWEIHRAHVCRGRRRKQQQQQQPQETTATTTTNNVTEEIRGNKPPLISDPHLSWMETVECEACHILVPIHNLELHLAHACTALHELPQRGEQAKDQTTSSSSSEPQSYVLGDDNDSLYGSEEREWECPKCTFLNQEHESKWKCVMCEYSPLAALEEEEEPKATANKKEVPNNQIQEKSSQSRPFWRNLVKTWVPEEMQKYLPPSMVEENGKRPILNKSFKGANRQQKQSPKPKNSKRAIPPRAEVRYRRNKHLSWIERERQQYLQILKTTRQEQKTLREQAELDEINRMDKQETIQDIFGQAQSQATANANEQSSSVVAVHQEAQHQQDVAPSKMELLQATEQLCLYHLEQLRRTHWVQELAQDIALLGLQRWRHHLHHLLDLYQSAGEMYVDNIIWELRMHFMQYAILEVMALLELAIWKAQIYRNANDQVISTKQYGKEERHACRNDRDISIICQSVLPFLGRPLTPALRNL